MWPQKSASAAIREGTQNSRTAPCRRLPKHRTTTRISARCPQKKRAEKLFAVKSSVFLHASRRAAPALHWRRAPARVREDLPRHVLTGAQLQSSWHGPRGCGLRYCGHHDRWFEGQLLREHRSLTSLRSLMRSPSRLCQSSASWFVVEYWT